MMLNSPWTLAFDSWSLMLEASAVIAMRTARFATGDATAAEAQRMVSEKMEAAAALQMQAILAAMGGSPLGAHQVVRHYRGKVRRNRARLARRRVG
jgi:hypothetical protein